MVLTLVFWPLHEGWIRIRLRRKSSWDGGFWGFVESKRHKMIKKKYS